ncbi:hypothetical protein NC651_016685 [Populus alba x Populus x berolinensis]|nr:hypothetical protein NC651_016685 [Populus alba x Populus x berolinensis]
MGLRPRTVWTCFRALRALLILFKTMNKTLSALLPVLFPKGDWDLGKNNLTNKILRAEQGKAKHILILYKL